MKKYFLMILFNFNLFAQRAYLPMPPSYSSQEVQILDDLKSDCPMCSLYFDRLQKLYNMKSQISAILQDKEKWVNTISEPVRKQQVQNLLKEIEDVINQILIFIAHDPRVQSSFDKLNYLLNKIEPLLPTVRQFQHKEFYDLVSSMYDLHQKIETNGVPTGYQEWLKKRLALKTGM